MSNEQVKTIKCPFFSHHVMPYERFLSHLEKCQFPDKKSYRKCKFNPYHVYHMDGITSHENKCPDKKKYEEDDDDWGVPDVPQKQEKLDWESEMSFTNSSQLNNSKNSKSMALQQPKKPYQNKKNKFSKKEYYDNDNVGKKVEKQQPMSNSVFEVQDLDDFNPC